MENNMRINEIFFSLQGEGKGAGRPTLFIRLSGCTLQCNFCDTKYHIKSRCFTKHDEVLLSKYKHWTITGGEPMLQQSEIVQWAKKYKPHFIEVETNGTVMPDMDTLEYISRFNVSPKEARFQPKALKGKTAPVLLGMRHNAYDKIVKFVYSDKKSANFIGAIISKYNLLPEEVWIMPEGKSRKEQLAKKKEVWAYCMKHGFNFSPRLHVDTFDLKRGI